MQRRHILPVLRVLVAVGIVVLLVREDLSTVADAVGVGTALATVTWPWWTRLLEAGPPSVGQARAAAVQLAVDVETALRAESASTGLLDPDPLPVSWRLRVHDPDVSSVRAGGVDQLLEVVERASARRVVVLGQAGAGKSTAGLRLVLQGCVKARESAGPPPVVPVLLHLSGWDPRRQHLVAWASSRLERDFAGLRRSRRFGTGVAGRLITNGGILLVLDGLDELPLRHRERVVDALDTVELQRFVLLSREDEYDQLGPFPLRAAYEVELLPLSPEQAASYLMANLPPDQTQSLAATRRSIVDLPQSPLARVLRTPLFLVLARRLVVARRGAPDVLRDPPSDEDRLRAVLLDGLVDAAFPDGPGHPQRASTYRSPAARRRLVRLARILDRRGRTEFAWWDVPSFLPWPVQATVVGTAGGVLLLPFVPTVWDAVTLAVVVAAAVAAATTPTPDPSLSRPMRVLRSGPLRATAVLAAATTLQTARSGDVLGALISFLPLVVVLAVALTTLRYALREMGLLGLRSSTPRRPGWLWQPARARLALLVAALVLFDHLLLPPPPLAEDEAIDPLATLATVTVGELAAALAFAFCTMVVVAAALMFGVPLAATSVASARRPLRANLAFGACAGCWWVATALVLGVAITWPFVEGGEVSRMATATPAGLPLAAAVAFAVLYAVLLGGLTGLVVSAAGRFTLTVALAWVMGLAPRRPLRFLEVAHARGVLRRHGWSYRFRHLLLQEQLARAADDGVLGRRADEAP